jgi:hypothetical protein
MYQTKDGFNVAFYSPAADDHIDLDVSGVVFEDEREMRREGAIDEVPPCSLIYCEREQSTWFWHPGGTSLADDGPGHGGLLLPVSPPAPV